MNDKGKNKQRKLINNQGYNNNKHLNVFNNTIENFSYSIEAPWKRTSNVRTSPSRSFGKSARSITQKVQAPGPGAYNLNKTTLLKGYVSFKGTKYVKVNTEAPGPNAYQPVDLFATKKYSFTRSQQTHKIQKSPSPGAYELYIKDKSPLMSFSKSAKNEIVQKEKINIPGPGKYQIEDELKRQLDFSFPHAKKFRQSNQQIREKAEIPGPGQYDLASVRKNIKTTKFTKTIRNFMKDSKIPGPGAYDLQKSSLINRGGILSSQKRVFSYENGVPGPGNYKQVDLNVIKKSEVGIIINKSRQTDSKHLVPGPSYYNKEIKQKIVGGVIGRQSRKSNAKLIQSAYDQLFKTNGQQKYDRVESNLHHNTPIIQDNKS